MNDAKTKFSLAEEKDIMMKVHNESDGTHVAIELGTESVRRQCLGDTQLVRVIPNKPEVLKEDRGWLPKDCNC